MPKKNQISFTVFEHSKVTVGSVNSPQRLIIDRQTFDEILMLSSMSNDVNGNKIEQFIDICCSKGQQFIKFNNYVGVITLPCGVTFEILPKISNGTDDVAYARKTVLKMLEVSSYIKPQTNQLGTIDIAKIPIFEIYISLFLKEIDILIKRGLKSTYIEVEENVPTLNGKIIFTKHVLHNFVHKERFYVSHDIYHINRPENKIIKSTLLKLKNISNNFDNLRNIKRLLLNMDSVEQSLNIREDLSQCLTDRSVAEYREAIRYSKVFLLGNGFSIYNGAHNCVSLLFPTELLYQEYVYHQIYRALSQKGYKVSRQDTSCYLFTDPQKFQLRPDIVVSNNTEKIIIDTKWKIIEKEGDISQSDMYQMYVYHKRYQNVKKVVLLYPMISSNRPYLFASSDNVVVQAQFVKLLIEDNHCLFDELLKTILIINS